MASGAKVSDNVKTKWNDMKVVKNDADASERIRVLKIGFKEECTIDVTEEYKEKDLEGKDVFLLVKNLMQPKSCCYLVYDCHYETNETKKEELIFILWSDDNGACKEKMQYASSKDALKKILTGVKRNLQINDFDVFATRKSFAESLGIKMTALEGTPMDS